MSEQRLSKLQKVILGIISEHGGVIERKQWDTGISKYLFPEVMKHYNPEDKKSVSASLSRSIRNLEQKGLIHTWRRVYGHNMLGKIELTENGLKLIGYLGLPISDKTPLKIIDIVGKVINDKDGGEE